jgi:glycosyltransferase involved in cell wall biosynthesis
MLGYQGPAFVIPGNGGVDIGTFHPGAKVVPDFLDIEDDRAVLLNPRGIRRYIRNHQWFAALAELKSRGTAFYAVCPGMLGHPMAERLVNRYGLKDQVILLPHMAPNEMAALYRLADVSVSLSDHDGTPNTLLEAMGCGTFPVVSVLPSYREWLSDGETCLEVRGRTPGEAADVIGRAIESSGLRRAAVDRLSAQVRDRASRNAMAASIADVYNEASRIRR